ncbi:MAG: galactokinase [Victivallales bacterium]|nr:galactokinase [Victivallales bacterium]
MMKMFGDAYGKGPAVVSRAPGRLEILGNHTDYNEGFVLSAAVDRATEFALSPVDGKDCEIRDFRDGSVRNFNLDSVDQPKPGDWANYVKGMICEIRKRGHDVGGFNAAILSTIPLSAGMSSSAALEISAGFAFAKAFGIELPKEEWARVGQGVENNYMGLKSGLLDQFSSIFGQKDSLIFCDFRSVSVERTVRMPEGYSFVVANSMVKHNLVDSEYNARRRSCERAAGILAGRHPEVKTLRDVSTDMIEDAKGSLDNDDYLKALHVVGENERVLKAIEMIEKGDVQGFGNLLYESQESSRVNFANSCREIDCLIELSRSVPGCIGARLSGGGFGGITIHLVKDSDTEQYRARLDTAYKLQTGLETSTLACSIGSGAAVVYAC